MPRKIRQLKADLLRAGFSYRTAKGSHTFWSHPLLPTDQIALSGGDGSDAQRYQEQQVRTMLQKLHRLQGGQT